MQKSKLDAPFPRDIASFVAYATSSRRRDGLNQYSSTRRPKKDRDDVLTDIEARKASGGAVERIAGGAKKNVGTGMKLVQRGDVWKIEVQYVDDDGRPRFKHFDDTPEGAEKAEKFVFKHVPGALRRLDLMENTVAAAEARLAE